MMRWILLALFLPVTAWGVPTTQPGTQSSTEPATQPVGMATTPQPTAVPFKLTDTNHILIRLKINGKGPFNFIVDTGAPAMIVRVPVAEKVGLKANDSLARIRDLEIEGGVHLRDVQCVVETPYQIEGMNAIGASGVDLDGLLGYGILSRFRLQMDMSKQSMIWTPVGFSPTDLKARRNRPGGKHSTTAPATKAPATTLPVEEDPAEATLESTGMLLKVLGPLIKPIDMPPQYRGAIGVGLTQTAGNVEVETVFGDSPSEHAGILAGDRLISVNGTAVHSIDEAQKAVVKNRSRQSATLEIQRGQAQLKLKIICGDEL